MPALALESLDRDPVIPVVRGHVADASCYRCPVRFDCRVTGEPRNPAALGEHVVGADHHLRWDTTEVGALTTDQAALDAEDIEALVGKRIANFLAADAQAKDDHIDALRHYLVSGNASRFSA
jgi:hypothetical protein